jgi:HK97 family phage major capsid protein
MTPELEKLKSEIVQSAQDISARLKAIEDGKDAESGTLKKMWDDFAKVSAEVEAQRQKQEQLMAAVDSRIASADANRMGGREKFGSDLMKCLQANEQTISQIMNKTNGVSLRFKTTNDMSTGNNMTGNIFERERMPGVYHQSVTRLHARDIFPSGQTSQPVTEWVVETAKVSAPTSVARELSRTENTKPGTGNDLELKTTNAKALAHYKRLPLSWMRDYPAVVAFIQTIGLTELLNLEDQQIITGSGVGTDVLGLTTTATASGTAFGPGVTVDFPSIMDIVRLGQAQLSNISINGGGFDTNFIVMNPMTFALFQLTKDQDGRLLYPNLLTNGIGTINNIPVIQHRSLAQNRLLFGDANQVMIQFYSPINVAFAYEDRDNFIKNLVTIRIEEEIKLPIFQPAGLMYISDIDAALALITEGGE